MTVSATSVAPPIKAPRTRGPRTANLPTTAVPDTITATASDAAPTMVTTTAPRSAATSFSIPPGLGVSRVARADVRSVQFITAAQLLETQQGRGSTTSTA